MLRDHRAFTLIELLIVVAIIAILASIATPNFLEAQTRSKIGRIKGDLRSLATALEAYRIDNNDYVLDDNFYGKAAWIGRPNKPPEGALEPVPLLAPLTTPIPYITSIPMDIFKRKALAEWGEQGKKARYYVYASRDWIYTQTHVKVTFMGKKPAHAWALSSIGPDLGLGNGSAILFGESFYLSQKGPGEKGENPDGLYDPTNGTISNGDIVRAGP